MNLIGVWIELHDSTLARVIRDGTTVVLHFHLAYMHRWEQHDGVLRGSGWSIPARIALEQVSVAPEVDQLPMDISDGSLRIDGRVLRNMLPVPLRESGEIEFDLVLVSGQAVRAVAGAVLLELTGEPTFVEALPDDLLPDDTGC